MIELATSTADDFRPLVGASFAITLPTGAAAEGTLTEVTEHPRGGLPGKRVPFSLLFEVRDESPHPAQGTIRLAHEAIGSLDLFAVPVGRSEGGVSWQIVFG